MAPTALGKSILSTDAAPHLNELTTFTGVGDDGRVDIEIPPTLSRRLSRLLPVSSADHHQLPTRRLSQVWTVPLNIVIHVVGSRGDVQPFLALACELQQRGHRVRLATHDLFREMIQSSGVEFYPVGGDPKELMAYMVKNPGLLPSLSSLRAGDVQSKRRMVARMLDGFWKSCIEPDPTTDDPFVADAIIANPPSFAHVHCAEALGVPLHMMFTMPWSPTEAFPHPLVNLRGSSEFGERRIAHYISYGIVDFMTWQGLGDVINDWRHDILGLEHVPMNEGPDLLNSLDVPFTYCWSPSLVPKPDDWGPNTDVCGFFFRELPDFKPPIDLTDFLESGPMPVYIGFGSIVVEEPDQLMTIVLRAVSTLGIRAIVSGGWSDLRGDSDNPDIYYIGDCPHEWLFQHVAAVVHHGGAGTTACGLRFGRPTVIVPFFGDQAFWGETIAAAGAGPRPIPYKKLTSRALAEAISIALKEETMAAATRICEGMSTESGVNAAVGHFHSHLPLSRLKCDLFPTLPAAWVYKGRHNTVLLSKRAEAILSRQGKLEKKNLKLHQSHQIGLDSRRWDPVTAVGSATFGVAMGMADAAADTFVKPYETIKDRKGRPEQTDNELTPTDDTRATSQNGSNVPVTSSNPGTAAAAAAAQGVGRFFITSAKGIVVDIPVAAADGLRAVPNLYGEEVRPRPHITGFRSGTKVATSNLGHGLFEALTDIGVYTYQGKKEQGPVGVVKGLGKGLASFVTKTTSSLAGAVAYPAQGAYRSIRAAVVTETVSVIKQATQREGQWILEHNPSSSDEERGVVADFSSLCR